MDFNNNQQQQNPYAQGANPQGNYNPQGGYNPYGAAQYGYPQNGYPQNGYSQPGYQQPGNQQYGYDQYGNPQNVYPQYSNPGYGYGMPQFQPFDEKSAKKNFSRIGLSYFLFWVVSLAATFVFALILQFCAQSFYSSDFTDSYLVRILASLLPMYLVGAPVCWLLMNKVPAEKPARNKWNFGQIVGGFIVGYSLMYIGSIIGSYIGTIIESFFPDAQASTNNVQELVLTGEMWVNILAMVMIGPVVEELLFRKLLCDRLKPYGDGITVVVTGLMFGLFHGNLTQGIYAFLFGAFLAYVYLRTGNIFITIGYHVTANFMGSVLPLLALSSSALDGYTEILETGDTNALTEFISENAEAFAVYGLYVMMVFGLMIAGIVIMIVTLARGRVKFEPGRIRIPSGRRFATVIVNVGMILFLIASFAEILMSTFG